MGNGTGCCSGKQINFHENMLAREAKLKQKQAVEECTEAPVKQNKKQEIHENISKQYDDNKHNLAVASTHNIGYLMDADAATKNDGSDEDYSLSDLSDGFGADGETIPLKAEKKEKSHKSILRYKSKAKWDDLSLEQHETEMQEQMRRLSVTLNLGQ